jgi:hypothetical protein
MDEQEFSSRPGAWPLVTEAGNYWALPIDAGEIDPIGSPTPKGRQGVSMMRRDGPRAGSDMFFDLDSLRSYAAQGGISGSVALTKAECTLLVNLTDEFFASRHAQPLGPRSRLSTLACRL